MRNVLESTTIIDHYPAVIDRYFKHRHSIHNGPFHIYLYMIFSSGFMFMEKVSINGYQWKIPMVWGYVSNMSPSAGNWSFLDTFQAFPRLLGIRVFWEPHNF